MNTITKSSFFTEQTVNVTIQSEDTSVPCILSFGDMRMPQLRVQDFSQASEALIKQLSGETRELSCSGVQDGQIYTLHDLDVQEGVIHAEFITFGKSDFTFDSVEVHLTGLSMWIEGMRGSVYYTHLRDHETPEHLVCRILLEKTK